MAISSVHPHRLVKVRPSVSKRFYEPIALLCGIYKATSHNQPSKSPDLSSEATQSTEHDFHNFVNKLGQLCNTKKDGNTVTAFVVLQFPDVIQYRFASNQLTNESSDHAKTFITYILQSLGKASKDGLQGMVSPILRTCLSFARPRVECYIKNLNKYSATCISKCISEDTTESASICGRLEKTRSLSSFCDHGSLDDKTFSKDCEALITDLVGLYDSNIEPLIRNRTNEGRINQSECWCEFRHAAGRLISYLGAVKILIATLKKWPELFEIFEVRYVASSKDLPNPLKAGNLTTHGIIGRMTSDLEKMSIYRSHAQELQRFDLDDTIRKHCESTKFRPVVHAEVLLLESLQSDGYTHPSCFFNSYKYIGCGKPTCRLCDYYFSVHPSGVEVRPTNRNLYPNWRMPDVYGEQGSMADKKRENLMSKVLERVREDAFRSLSEKFPERKHQDSNTDPTYPIDSVASREPVYLDDLIGGFQVLTMNRSNDTLRLVERSLSDVESDDEEDGGVKI